MIRLHSLECSIHRAEENDQLSLGKFLWLNFFDRHRCRTCLDLFLDGLWRLPSTLSKVNTDKSSLKNKREDNVSLTISKLVG